MTITAVQVTKEETLLGSARAVEMEIMCTNMDARDISIMVGSEAEAAAEAEA